MSKTAAILKREYRYVVIVLLILLFMFLAVGWVGQEIKERDAAWIKTIQGSECVTMECFRIALGLPKPYPAINWTPMVD